MLNTIGEAYERLHLGRLNEHIVGFPQALSSNRFGLGAGRSVSLNVRNAFDSGTRDRTVWALRPTEVPVWIVRILRSYLEDRTLSVGPGRRAREVKCGVPPCSVLGPVLWNLFTTVRFSCLRWRSRVGRVCGWCCGRRNVKERLRAGAVLDRRCP